MPNAEAGAARRVPPPDDPAIPAATKRIELLLPLKPCNGSRGSDLARVRDALLPSFNRFCDPGFIASFTIVVPDVDLDRVTSLQSASDFSLTIVGERALLGGAAVPADGWFIQQMVKIAYAGRCRAGWYLTLDADTFLTDFLDERLFDGDRAPTHLEPADKHPGWWPAAAATLHGAPPAAGQPVLGVTPAFLSAEIMLRVIDRLSRIGALQSLTWPAYLATMVGDGFHCWTEYALYWTTLTNTDAPERLHYARATYVHCESPVEARQRIRAGGNGNGPLFGVMQSSAVGAAEHVAYVRKMLRGTEPGRDPRRALGLHGGYHYVHPRHARDMVGGGGDALLVSASGNADALAAALGMNERWPNYGLLCRLPAPPALPGRPELRVIYVIDEPGDALLAMADGRQADICKNNNINFLPAFWDELTEAEYAGAGEDLLNLYEHVRDWTDPEGPLCQAGYDVLILRRSEWRLHADTIVSFLGLVGKTAASVRRRLRALPASPIDAARRDWMAPIYAPLHAYIDAFPAAALWDAQANVLLALDPQVSP